MIKHIAGSLLWRSKEAFSSLKTTGISAGQTPYKFYWFPILPLISFLIRQVKDAKGHRVFPWIHENKGFDLLPFFCSYQRKPRVFIHYGMVKFHISFYFELVLLRKQL